MQTWTPPRATPAPRPAPAAPAAPSFYVPLPRRLAEDLRDSPVAVGVFALLARAFRANGQPIPLSPADLSAFDPSLSYGAATRALQRLAASGWLIAARRPGHKTTYRPAWGQVHDAPVPWDLAAPSLGRPRHVAALRLDQALLDTCMGRLAPHPIHPATVQRYVETPLLSLREVGAYALALAGLPVPSPTLEQLGLLATGQPQPLPAEATLLAVASQRSALTPAGWRRTPFSPAPDPAPAPAPGQALFFVPPGQIGPMIGSLIADPITPSPDQEVPPGAPECVETPSTSDAAGSHGVMYLNGENPTTSAILNDSTSGGGDHISDQTADNTTPPPATYHLPPATCHLPPASRLLQSIGIRRSVAANLADRPEPLVARLIAQARARTDVRDLAGWVVAALRDLPAEMPTLAPEPPPSVFTIHEYPGLSDEERDRWVWRFHRAATPADKRAVLARLEQEHPR
jgi:hypothetical protein